MLIICAFKMFLLILFTTGIVFADENIRAQKGIVDYTNEAGEPCTSTFQGEILLSKGQRGDKGLLVTEGMTGIKGMKGDLGDNDDCLTSISISGEMPLGVNKLKPYPKLCEEVDQDGYFWVREVCPFKVFCEKDKKSQEGNEKYYTCLRINENNIEEKELDYTNSTKPFWLSEHYDFTGKNYYENKVLANQITWLRRQSWEMKLKYKYSCINSPIINPFKADQDLRLLSWNSGIIGTKATETMPFKYEIQEDNCSHIEDMGHPTWKHSYITLEGLINRLPIIDVNIRNIDKKYKVQKLKFALRELCFA